MDRETPPNEDSEIIFYDEAGNTLPGREGAVTAEIHEKVDGQEHRTYLVLEKDIPQE